MENKSHNLIKFTLITLILCGGGYFLWQQYQQNNMAIGQQTHARQAKSLAVVTIAPQTVTITEAAPGRVVAYKTAEIRPQVNGIILKRIFKEGSAVEEKAPLYQIDPALYQAAYENAKADLNKAEVNLHAAEIKNKRYQKLIQSSTISKQEFDDNEAALEQTKAELGIAQAALKEAKINLDYTTIYAPIAGQIGKSLVSEGSLVTANQNEALAVITQLDPIYVDASISSTALMQLKRKVKNFDDIPVNLIIHNNESYDATGQFQFLDVQVDTTTDSIPSRSIFPNANHLLLPGLFAQVEIKVDYDDAILIPQSATLRQPDGTLAVWSLNKDNTAILKTIQAHRMVRSDWLVESGLKPGDVIITEGLINLRPGLKINPIQK